MCLFSTYCKRCRKSPVCIRVEKKYHMPCKHMWRLEVSLALHAMRHLRWLTAPGRWVCIPTNHTLTPNNLVGLVAIRHLLSLDMFKSCYIRCHKSQDGARLFNKRRFNPCTLTTWLGGTVAGTCCRWTRTWFGCAHVQTPAVSRHGRCFKHRVTNHPCVYALRQKYGMPYKHMWRLKVSRALHAIRHLLSLDTTLVGLRARADICCLSTRAGGASSVSTFRRHMC